MNGSRTQPRKIERELFLEVFDRPTPGERAAFLNEACAADPSLRAVRASMDVGKSKRMKMQHFFLACAVTLALSAQALFSAENFDWPQWQGPNRNSMSKETGLLKEWPKDGPPLAWKLKELDGGDSAPSIAAGNIFGMSNRGEDEVVWALSEKDGKGLWVTRPGPAYLQGMPQGQDVLLCYNVKAQDK